MFETNIQCNSSKKGVRFASKVRVATFQKDDDPVMVTYNLGADGNYVSEKDFLRAGMPILQRSTRRVDVANTGTSNVKWETTLPLPHHLKEAAKADSFDKFPTLLMSVGKTNDDGNVSIFTRDGVTVHKEEDVLITCKGAPILVGVRDERGRYHIPLAQRQGEWRPYKPSKAARIKLGQANTKQGRTSDPQRPWRSRSQI